MLIQCLIKRIGGTRAEIDDKQYHFKPNELGDHVCEVADNKHVQRFLKVDDAYTIYEAGGKAKPKEVEPVELRGFNFEPSIVELDNGEKVSVRSLVQTAFEKSGKKPNAWNKQTDDEVAALVEAEYLLLNTPQNPVDDSGEGGESAEAQGSEEAKEPAVAPEVKPEQMTKAQKRAALAKRKAELGQV